MANFNWNSVVEAAVGVSNNWSDTVKSTRSEKEATKKHGVNTVLIISVVICITVIVVVILSKK